MTIQEVLRLRDKDVIVLHFCRDGKEYWSSWTVFGKPVLSKDGKKLILCPKHNANVIDVEKLDCWYFPTSELVAGYALATLGNEDKHYSTEDKKCFAEVVRELIDCVVRYAQ